MLQRLDLRDRHLTTSELLGTLPRAEVSVEDAADRVAPILADVRNRGAAALRDYAERFDGVRPEHLRVPAEAFEKALAGLDGDVRLAIEESITRVRAVHSAQRPDDHEVTVAPGAVVRQRWIPVRRVGLYVPGGLAVYPSSVVMNVVAAQEAGVQSVALVSPPQVDQDGLPHPTILAACALLGVDEVYAVGGAQAIGMLAYGAAGSEPIDGAVLCDPVDIVTGPGNVYVAAAKRLVRAVVGIDAEAGPTEIAVLADSTADAALIASDLISQAEHDEQAGSVLITDSDELANAVDEEIASQAVQTKHADRVRIALSGPQSAIVLVRDLDHGIEVADAYAAEHLEIHTADASDVANRITNAGAIFVGPWSPVPLGDYIAGSNHVLPTGGTARYASGLGVHSFLRAVHVVEYDRDALEAVADQVVAFADAEDLPAHGEAIRVRFTQR